MSGLRSFRATGLCLLLVVAVVSAEECDKTKCKGPIRYYEDLKCKPVYENEGDCCAVRYDCSHLNGRSADKCYSNGREYNVGEKLNDEDRASPCDIGCMCINGPGGARFTCASVDCFNMRVKEGCYFRHAPDSCCGGEEVCPASEDERIKCDVNGKTYLDGQSFNVEDDPSLVCYCMEGYKGENVEPFCRRVTCGTELRRSQEIRENCVPIYYSQQVPRTSCSVAYRCQNNNDIVISSANKKDGARTDSKEASEEMMCKFGNMNMRVGDELNQATDYSSVCVKCTCEVPPTPTCQRLPDEECDVTNHPLF